MMSFKTISLRKAIILGKLQGRATVACTQAFVEVISAFQGFKARSRNMPPCMYVPPLKKWQRVRQKHHPSSSYVRKEGGKLKDAENEIPSHSWYLLCITPFDLIIICNYQLNLTLTVKTNKQTNQQINPFYTFQNSLGNAQVLVQSSHRSSIQLALPRNIPSRTAPPVNIH